MKLFFNSLVAVGGSVAFGLILSALFSFVAPQKTDVNSIRVEEAEKIVNLYEIRLFNVKVKSEQEDLKLDHIKNVYETSKKASHAIPAAKIREYKAEYDWWMLQDKIKDIEEAEIELELAKIRVKLARIGVYVNCVPIKQVGKE